MSVAGIWHLDIKTPIGTQLVTLELVDSGGETTGLASGRDDDEAVPLRDIALDGDRLTWKQSITRPMRLDLVFDVIVDGETLRGTAKAGRLPSSTVTGKRG